MLSERHTTVLLHESVTALELLPGAIVLDATTGNGGHSKLIAEAIGPKGKLICTDLDQDALDEAKKNLSESRSEISFHQMNFRELDQALTEAGVKEGELDGALFDLGIRTEQIFLSGRGFSFKALDEPLLMTFSKNPEEGTTARDALNYWSEETLSNAIFVFGDERKARKIARYIVQKRETKPFERVGDLVEVIERAYKGGFAGKTNPSTKTFQALRIAVNDEMGSLKEGLEKAQTFLKPGGRISVITFHSLEDRIVKQFSRELADRGEAEIVFKKPLVPSQSELEENPRARSAKLRAWKKLVN